jgi:hypothetical protein
MAFNGTNWSAVNNINDLMSAANGPANGYFWTGMLYMIWVVLTILFINLGFEVAVLTSSFICFIIGLSLLYANLVSLGWGILPFVGIILSIILYITWSTRSDSWG